MAIYSARRMRIAAVLKENGIPDREAEQISSEAQDMFSGRPALRRYLIHEFKLWAPLPRENLAWHEGRRSALLLLLQLSGLTAAETLDADHDRTDRDS